MTRRVTIAAAAAEAARGGHDDGPNHASLQDSGKLLQLARHGRDDKGGDDRGGGKDDGPNHA